jgi:MFS family permease
VSATPHYASQMLPAMLLTGIGVGLALPTLISTSATALPPERFGTGSAVVNTARQVASALGVAILVTVLGTPHSAEAARNAFRHSWIVAAVANLLAAGVALLIRRAVSAPAPVPGPASAPVEVPA